MTDIDMKSLSDADLKALTQKCEEEQKNRIARLQQDKWFAVCQAWEEYEATCGAIRDHHGVRIHICPSLPGRVNI